MANKAVMAYIKKDSFIHNLTGTTKLFIFLLFSLTGMLTYDTRVLIAMFFISLFLFYISKIKIREIKVILIFMGVFLSLNVLLLFLFSPLHGVELYGSRTDLLHLFGPYTITAEELFYLFNNVLKYIVALPIAILFISTTNPSEFAASLNSIKVPAKISYSFALALRYIPDIQKDFKEISKAQQAKGIHLDKKTSVKDKLTNSVKILLPLIFSSLNRIEVISNAMELRRFGKYRTRTWYSKKKFKKNDLIALIFMILLFIIAMVVTFHDLDRFYNPFI